MSVLRVTIAQTKISQLPLCVALDLRLQGFWFEDAE